MNGFKRSANVRRWTKTAEDCFNRGCKCQGCYFNDFFSNNRKCQMKLTVLELVRVLGAPENSNGKDMLLPEQG